MRADGFAAAYERQLFELFTVFVRPADLTGGHADYQGVVGHVFIDYRVCADRGKSIYGDAADDGAVRTQRRAGSDQSITVFVFAFD